MAFSVLNARFNKPLIPMYPSSGSTGLPIHGDLVYHTSNAGMYAACSSVLPSTIGRKIIGILEHASTASTNLGYIIPVNGELLEADMTTALSATISSTFIGSLYRCEYSTAYGTLVDLSTEGVDGVVFGSTENPGGSSCPEVFCLTGYSTVTRKAHGFVPSGLCY